MTRELDRSIIAQATLFEATGLQAAAARAIIATLDMMSRSSGPKKVFASLAPSVTWCLAKRPASAESATDREVESTLESARRSVSSSSKGA